MGDDQRDLPVRAPLDRSALERVLARAAELQAAEGESDGPGLSDAQLVEIAKEVGLAPANLRQALAEERSGGDAPAARGTMDLMFGSALASSSRTVRGTPDVVLNALDLTMQQEEGLRVKRRFSDRTLWERAPGIVANLSRAFDLAGRGYHLARTDDVGATVVAVDGERTLVRLDASLAAARAQGIGIGAIIAVLGGISSAAMFLLPFPPVIAALPAIFFLGVGWVVARTHRRARQRAQLALEQVLDRLERNERPRPSLLASIVTPARPR